MTRVLGAEPWAPSAGSWGADLATCRPGSCVTAEAHREARARARRQFRFNEHLHGAEAARASCASALACVRGLRLEASRPAGDPRRASVPYGSPLRVRQPWCIAAARDWLAFARNISARREVLP